MKPVDFSYLNAMNLEQAENALAGQSCSIVSGNQSLGPMMNLRLARPGVLLDVSRVEELRRAEETDTEVRFGAAVTHAEIEDGTVPDPTGGWMRAAASNIAHRAVRNRGTIGGSLCHADPAADWVTVLPALSAQISIAGPDGVRKVDAIDFVVGPYATVLAPGEIVVSVAVPKPSAAARWGYWKFVRQVGEFSKASAAILDDPDTGRSRVIVGALGRQPLLIDKPDDVIAGRIDGKAALSHALPDMPACAVRMHAVAIDRAIEQMAGSPE
ncbi:carbon monoxide dehydrogenase [Hwanghaeella grinnelliae]|uniref:Carbon monoxide dehydrogenase n=1 Tax=Hwanghaeella grinnelliae TaxID=2500179 RepID=A0A3S2VP01_9PROT|nr:FAD binding domain-containing protein [Hwanghaeella grinnelliae]RVU35113.1 carbon monoxide dehydrogenase [Hwanghaeella grinnelliae]